MRGIGAIAFAGKPALVRIAVGDNATASRVLDMGAEAVVAPMINTVAEARALVAATKYPPLGERSWGPSRVLALRGTEQQAHLSGDNAVSMTFAMIETRRALEVLDDILAVEGIDGVFVGPVRSVGDPVRWCAHRTARSGTGRPSPQNCRTGAGGWQDSGHLRDDSRDVRVISANSATA